MRSIAQLPLLLLALAPALAAQAQPETLDRRGLSANVISPQSRVFTEAAQPVRITGVTVEVKIIDQAATTSFEIRLHNPGRAMAEGEMLLPVPAGAVIGKFDFNGAGLEPSASLLPGPEAVRIYNEIVRRYRDPALMQFVGLNLVRTSVFPIEAGGDQAIRFSYEQVLPAFGDRIDYELPRSEMLGYTVPWDIKLSVQSTRPLSTVYSPSHTLNVTRKGENALLAAVDESSRLDPGSFRVSYLLGDEGVTASLFAYPDPKIGGGYFLMIAGVPAKRPADLKPVPREVTLVLDRSGSMRGDKWKQACESVLQVITGLRTDERFNIIAFGNHPDSAFPKPVLRTAENEKAATVWLESLTPSGGTNIHDALLEALTPKPAEGSLPLVLFITDGLPTVGDTKEKAIRELVSKHNKHNRRVFTFGVGVDVNAPLLEALADASRARPTFVLPGEDVEVKVGDVFARLNGPLLANPILELPRGENGVSRLTEVLPRAVPDLFEGDQLVLIGRYTGDAPLAFRLGGDFCGTQRQFEFSFSVANATTRNSFVPRLWAGRKVAELIDVIRQADPPATSAEVDPRFKEVVAEIIALSTEFGILTEYTAFLALEGTDLTKQADVQREAWSNLQGRGQNVRSGNGGVSQSSNASDMKRQVKENKRNEWYDDKLNRVAVGEVQQVNDRAFYKRKEIWVDSRLLENTRKPDRTIKVGSDEYLKLLEKLTAQGRQGAIALEGSTLLEVDGEVILIEPQS